MDQRIIRMINYQNKYFFINVACAILLIILMFVFISIDSINEPIHAIIGLVILVAISTFLIGFIKEKIKYFQQAKFLKLNGQPIIANLNVNEFKVHNGRYLYYYKIVCYYVEGEKTYRFEEKIVDEDVILYYIFREIIKKGNINKKVTVLVDPFDYNRYLILKYELLDNLLESNREIVENFLI